MARKCVCVLSGEEAELWATRKIKPNCADHYHVTRVDAMEMLGRGDWQPYNEPIAEPAGGNAIRLLRTFAVRGLSCKVGGTLEAALRRNLDWAKAMLAQIQQRHEAPSGI